MKQPYSFIAVIFTLLFISPAHLVFAADKTERIAVAGGSITEIIYRLNEQHRIVGVDSTSQFPSEAKQHPLLGYVRNVSVEGVLSLKPDLLIGEKDTGPTKILNQIKAAGINTVIIEEDDTLSAINKKIRLVSQLLQVEAKGELLLDDILIDLSALQYARKKIKTAPRVLFLLSASNGSPIAAGNTTSAHTAIVEAGGINVLAQFQGWEKLSPEAAFSLNPDVIVVMNRGDNILTELKNLPHFKYSNAVKHNAVFTIDGNYLLGFGPRTPQAIVELGTMIHPNFPLPEGYKLRYPNNAGINTAGH
ncbi:MAG: heme/hemin ABC transporter substrate-binding protein [Cellvibrionaceae bacterium]